MDNLEYFNGITLTKMLGSEKDRTIKDKGASEKNTTGDSNSKDESQEPYSTRLPMPPSITNLKAISAAAIVASRRKVTTFPF